MTTQSALLRRVLLLASALATVLVFGAGMTTPALGATHLVPEDFSTIQAAIDASASLDTVLIAPGTYQGPGNRGLDLGGRSIVVRSASGPEDTIIDCQYMDRGFYLRNYETHNARIEGLTIQHGYAAQGGPGVGVGGGIFCSPAGPRIVNCRILNCVAYMSGGGLGLPVFWGVVDSCIIAGNMTTRYHGGGILAGYDGGLGAEIKNCIITGNEADYGGGVCFESSGPNHLVNCTVASNVAREFGGGLYAGAAFLLERSIVWGNCASSYGSEIDGWGTAVCSTVDTTGVFSVSGRVTYDHCANMDPLFCGPEPCGPHTAGDWSLDAASPCFPEHSPCGELIGALGMGCGTPPPSGACCFSNGSCLVLEPAACMGQTGLYMGDGTTCQMNPCQPTPVQSTTWGQVKALFR